MSLKRAIAANTTVQIAGKAVSALLGLAAVAIMTRALGVEKFGWYVTATGFLQFIGIFSDFGFIVTTAKMLSEPKFDKQKLINNLFTWRFVTALFFQLLAPLVILFFPYPYEVKLAVAITTASFFCISLNNVAIGWCQTNLKMIIQTAGEIIGRIVLVAGLIFIFKNNYGFLPMMAMMTLAQIAYTAYLWLRGPKVSFAVDRDISKEIYHIIWPTAVTVIFNAFYLQGDRVILPLYASQADVGLYGAAYRVLDIVTQSAAMIMGIMMPLVTFAWSRNLAEEFKRRYQTSLDLVSLLLMPMMIGIIALAKPIMTLVAGKDFAGSAPVIQILALAIFGLSFGNIFGYIALAINRQRQAIWIYVTDAVLTTAAYFIFIPRFGIYGAALVTVCSELFAGMALMLLANHYAGFVPSYKTLLKILLASGIMGASVYALQPLNIAASIAAGVLIYGALVLLTRTISKETIKEILSRGRS
jgi:O-antigen/teichoic acid export membrane protein